MIAHALEAIDPATTPNVERALALARELEATAGPAPVGLVIDRRESLPLGAGRDFLRRPLWHSLNARVNNLEKCHPMVSQVMLPCNGWGRPCVRFFDDEGNRDDDRSYAHARS